MYSVSLPLLMLCYMRHHRTTPRRLDQCLLANFYALSVSVLMTIVLNSKPRSSRVIFNNEDTIIKRTEFASRETLLAQTGHKSLNKHQGNVPVRFITSFNSEWREISGVLRKHWPVLLADEDVASHILDYPSVTWRRSKNLKDMTGPRWGSFQCGDCSACQFMERTSTFSNSSGDRVFSVTHFINCRTDNVIYFAKCACDLIYIGMTTRELRVRILEHVRDIKNGAMALDIETLKTIPKHFRKYHNSNPKTFKVRGIDRVQLDIRGGNYKKELLKKETRWTVELNTLAPKGLNEYISFKSFLG
ncbi:unnamed protein product [Ranitomeya imitator]|uniref:GIY-YIG domain-containing protein n=1 Tax=Ranitomeya imitator TaxID=111125 RepID=A0ABN9MMY1_9NEOB|nr:unnamed protein product [Ranitomeya imitator]